MFFGEWMGIDFLKMMPIMIDSGRGIQIWIRLEDTLLIDTVDGDVGAYAPDPVIERGLARRINGYWLKKLDEFVGIEDGCRIDTSVSDLPRVMRCPGTINQKTKRMAKILVPSQAIFHGLAQKMLDGVPPQVFWDPDPVPGIKAGSTWQEVYPHLTRMAQDYLMKGQEEPGRHKVMWHTAKKLRELGVERAEALRALRWANKLRGKEEALPLDQVKHAVATAYGS